MSANLSPERLLAIIDTQNRIAANALDLESTMSIVTEQATVLVNAAAAAVEIADGEQMVYRVGRGAAEAYRGVRIPISSSLSGTCLRTNTVLTCDDARNDERTDREACERVGAVSIVCVPLCHGDHVVGVLKVYDPRPGIFTDEDVETLSLLSRVIGSHMSHSNDYAVNEHASLHDDLTGLPNRRAFEERLEHEFVRLRRRGGKLCVCMLDLDGFKLVNDSQGHAAGDEVLRGVAQLLDQIRGDDQAYRFGGDEFAMILLDTDHAGADHAVRRLVFEIEQDPACKGVSASWGIAYARRNEFPQPLVARADEALYAMKRARARLRVAR